MMILSLSSANGGTDDWEDYSADSTIVGYSAFTTKQILYQKGHKNILVSVYLNGPSNSTSLTFTLPDNMDAVEFLSIGRTVNNGSSNVGRFFISSSGNTVTVNSDVTGSAWSAAGTKGIQFQFIYKIP